MPIFLTWENARGKFPHPFFRLWMAHISAIFVHGELKSGKNDRVPICGVSRAIAGTAGHPCQANAALARPRGQPPPRLSCRRPRKASSATI